MIKGQDPMTDRRLLPVEITAFDPDLLGEGAALLGLTHLSCVLSLSHATTFARDEVEHNGLDPWAHRVNVHSAQESADHGVDRLGDHERQPDPQIRVPLSWTGVSWGAWSNTNAPRQNATGCRCLFPDPWSFEEAAYWPNLNDLGICPAARP